MVRGAILLNALVSGLAIWIITLTDSAVKALSSIEYAAGALGAFVFCFLVCGVFLVLPVIIAIDSKGARQ